MKKHGSVAREKRRAVLHGRKDDVEGSWSGDPSFELATGFGGIGFSTRGWLPGGRYFS